MQKMLIYAMSDSMCKRCLFGFDMGKYNSSRVFYVKDKTRGLYINNRYSKMKIK